MPPPDRPNQFALLAQRRFAPFFWVQFLGAGNDNLFKFAFTVLVTYQLQLVWLPPALAGLVIGALFILPFVLFSATAGQLADKLEKARLIRLVKGLEIAIMLLAGWGFLQRDAPVLLACVFLMGLHSTLFGPVKFAYLPQHLGEREITGGNGMVEMGTFVAILLGQVAGGLLVALPEVGARLVAAACLAVALLGRAIAQAVPESKATDPGLKINWNPFSETWRNLKLARGDVVVFRSLLGISWMWFFGAVFLAMFPAFAKEVLHGDERVASLLLVLFSVGVGVGALACEMLSRRHVEIGLVPLGAIGMSLFAVDLYFASRALPASPLQPLGRFVAEPAHWRVMADLAGLSLSAGVYSVPMYALIQLRSLVTHRARIIAANNILNALFMIVSALGVGLLLQAGLTIPQVFLVVGLLNAAVSFYVFVLVPDYLLRFAAFVLARAVYRVQLHGDEHVPPSGAALLVCRPSGAVGALLLMAASPRPIRFVMDRRLVERPLLGGLFRLGRAIPLGAGQDDAGGDGQAITLARRALDGGELLCVFAEHVEVDGPSGAIDAGVLQILRTHPVPVVPLALGVARHGLFARIRLVAGAPLAGAGLNPASLRERLEALLDA